MNEIIKDREPVFLDEDREPTPNSRDEAGRLK